MEIALRRVFEEGRRERPNDPHTWTAEPPRTRSTQTRTRLRYRTEFMELGEIIKDLASGVSEA
jgi:hypothetical protein